MNRSAFDNTAKGIPVRYTEREAWQPSAIQMERVRAALIEAHQSCDDHVQIVPPRSGNKIKIRRLPRAFNETV